MGKLECQLWVFWAGTLCVLEELAQLSKSRS